MNHCVFIQTNHKQILGALVAQYAVRRNSRNNDKFDVRIINCNDYPFFKAREGQAYLRDGIRFTWLNDDLQSFTPTRFMPPELMGYQGRAVVIDPDIFAIADVWELLSRDMQGKAILCRAHSGPKGLIDRCISSSAMLLDCARLRHWKVAEQFNEMFEFKRDYMPWICLRLEDRATIGFFEPEWNDFDRLTARTRMLHTTRRLTQPWKVGLPIDFRLPGRFRLFPPLAWLIRARNRLFGEYSLLGRYREHPDRNQTNLFFGLLKECVEQGIVTEAMLREEMRLNHVRHDAFEVLERTPRLAPPGNPPLGLRAA